MSDCCPILFIYLSSHTVVMILTLAIHIKVLSKPHPNVPDWISAICHFLIDHHEIVQDKVCIIHANVANIVREIEDKNIITKWVTINRWKFSDEEAEIFASKLIQCVQSNLM